MKKIISLVEVFLFLTVFICGCGNKNATQNSSSPSSGVPETTEAEETTLSEMAQGLIEIMSKAQEEEDYIPDTAIDDGFNSKDYHGTLTIDSIGVSVDTYWVDIAEVSDDAQNITDDENMATYFRYGNIHVIADHVYQKFEKLSDVKEGDTAEITLADGTVEKYKCTSVSYGYNDGKIYDADTDDISKYPEGTLAMYTCLSDEEIEEYQVEFILIDQMILLTVWNPVT